ncbi:MAG: pyridoxal phosphate-dependent aminotransferase [Conexivisphaerales archaeon]
MLRYSAKAKYNLSASGMPEPNLRKMGINTSFEDFAKEPDIHESLLREVIAKLYEMEKEDVIITTGASESIFIAYSAFCKDVAIVPLPNYEPMFAIPKSLGCDIKGELSEKHFSNKVMVGITNPNNPVGNFVDDYHISNLANSLKKHKGILFSNETYREFKFDKPYHSFKDDNLIVCSSLTKFYGLGRLRIGWLVAKGENRKRLLRAKRLVSGHSSEYSMWIARQVLMNRTKFIELAKILISRNMRLLKRFIQRTDGIDVLIPDAAPFCLVKYKQKIDSLRFSKKLLEKTGVLVSPGDFFGSPRSFRLCITSDEAKLREGLDLLSEYIHKAE